MQSGCSHNYEFVLRPISSLTVQKPEGHQCLTGNNSIVLTNDKLLLDSNLLLQDSTDTNIQRTDYSDAVSTK